MRALVQPPEYLTSGSLGFCRNAEQPPKYGEALMPEAWSDKDERKYEHIKEGYEESGKSEDEAEEIAARTVNKGRREEGRTPNERTQGTGNPNTGLESRTKDELQNRAKDLNVSGYGTMSKDELIRAIREKD